MNNVSICSIPKSLQLYSKDIEQYKPLTRQEKREINRQLKQGGEAAELAREKLILSNLGKVVKLAQSYAGKGVALEDLIQAGNMALIKAAENFRADHERFWSKTVSSVYSAIRDEFRNNNSTARIPVCAQEDYEIIDKITDRFEVRNGRKPNLNEISRLSGKRNKKMLKEFLNGLRFRTETDIESIEGNELTPAEKLDEKILKHNLDSLLSGLSDTERLVIESAFGLKNGWTHNTYEISGIYKMPLFKVNMAFNRAIRKLREIRRKALLEEHIQNDIPENYNFAKTFKRANIERW